MINLCIFGAGRIGSVHTRNAHICPSVQVRYIVDTNAEAAQTLANEVGAQVADLETVLADPQVQGVVIASATHTHADLIIASAKANKHIFCEKPIDLDIAKVDQCLMVVTECGVHLMTGFNRRYDKHFERLKRAVTDQTIGKLEMVSITSRDPSPPPSEYIKVSGGLFRDMMIHDFDMARWLMGEEPNLIYAEASCHVDPEIARLGDVDTAVVTLKTPSGVLCQIGNSRRAVYGYDQRIEVFGSGGMMKADNETPTRVAYYSTEGVLEDNPEHFFMERYAEAYRSEMHHFLSTLRGETSPLTNGNDGRQALLLADAALKSLETGQPVLL
ncbi:MAG: inositol 2-dehydrogenase [Pseudomonadales bacterium]